MINIRFIGLSQVNYRIGSLESLLRSYEHSN